MTDILVSQNTVITTVLSSSPVTSIIESVATGSPTVLSSSSQGPPGPAFLEMVRYVAQTKQSVWRINHNKDTVQFHLKIYKKDGIIVNANHGIVDKNNIDIYFTCPVEGYVDILFKIGTMDVQNAI